jgi:dTDP-4-dehydrorhamnose 3,5-epimerase
MANFIKTDVEGSLVIECDRHFDSRGFFQELYNSESYFPESRIRWKQVNTSFSEKNVLRGLHLAPYAKLMTCISGRVFDVCVDMREGSPTYLKHAYTILEGNKPKQFFVPGGCAHGFLALENSTLVYCAADVWQPDQEFNLRYDDFGIQWPYRFDTGLDWLLARKSAYHLSDKDQKALSKDEYLKLKSDQ